MHINFRETYQSLSTAELLNIVKQANDDTGLLQIATMIVFQH